MTDPFVALMRRYVVDYTNSHDLAICDEIMEPDYVLRMGPHVVAGRDEAYKPATRKQLEQFPGLGLTVHDVVSNGERLALCFSEHGASVRHGGALAAWRGIGLYTWNGRRLTANRVEQDYLARRRQLAGGVPDAVPPPALAPWDTAARAPDAGVEAVVAAWAAQGAPAVGDVEVDDGRDPAPLVEADEVVVDDLFTAGDRAAVHVTVHGPFRGGLPELDDRHGAPATLHAAALVTVADGRVVAGRVVRDRLGLARALAAVGAAP
ncbi:ester cyclase [Actinomycetospora straminea]|uniref:SnoaL-like domain-containing protein n=1 Tax=Actinomycetospora straminea TaxID=663607 RepID=A0ABP9FB25_9PSEU|nr:ester cyclase [Actinomycetospora straminea]MDD7936367.1 ester cyclase [Actinomycetospora straminea]